MILLRFSPVIAAALLTLACSHPLEIVGQGDIYGTDGRDCSYEQFNAPQADGAHPCPNYVTGDYEAYYTASPRDGWRFYGWENYCEGSFSGCQFSVPASAVDQFAGQSMPPLVARFERLPTLAPLAYDTLPIHPTTGLYRQSDDSFLLATRADSPTYPGQLVRFDAHSGQVTSLLTLDGTAYILELSKNQDILYISYSDDNRFDIFDMGSQQVSGSVDLGSQVTDEGVFDLFATSMAASPVVNDLVAVSMKRGSVQSYDNSSSAVALYKSGAQLGDVATAMDRGGAVPRNLEFAPLGQWVWGDRLSSLVVTDTGFGRKLDNCPRGCGVKVPTYIGATMFSGNLMLDRYNRDKLGSYLPQDDWLIDAGGVTRHTPNLNRGFNYSEYSKALHTVSTQRFVPTGAYDLPLSGDLIDMLPSNTHLVVLSETGVVSIDQDNLSDMFNGGCDARSLRVEVGRKYTRIDCKFRDVIVNSAGDKAYATVSASQGATGNSIAVIDIASGQVERYIPTVSDPDKLVLSVGEDKLFVSAMQSNYIHQVDIVTGNTDGVYRMGDAYGSVGSGAALLPSNASSRAFIAHTYSEVLQSIGPLQSVSNLQKTGELPGFTPSAHVEITADSRMVIAELGNWQGNTIRQYQVDQSGFSLINSEPTSLDKTNARFALSGDTLVFADGDTFELVPPAGGASLSFPGEGYEDLVADANNSLLYSHPLEVGHLSFVIDRIAMPGGVNTGSLGLDARWSRVDFVNTRKVLAAGEHILLLVGGDTDFRDDHVYIIRKDYFD